MLVARLKSSKFFRNSSSSLICSKAMLLNFNINHLLVLGFINEYSISNLYDYLTYKFIVIGTTKRANGFNILNRRQSHFLKRDSLIEVTDN